MACNPAGGFVVAWQGDGAGGSGVHARKFDDGGAALTGDIDVAGVGARNASVAVDGTGGFLVAYDTPSAALARPCDAAGAPLGPAVQLEDGVGTPALPDAAANASGAFVVVWEEGSSDAIHGRRLDASAALIGGEVMASVPGAFSFEGNVSIDPASNFVVAWTGDDVPFGYKGIQARSFDAGGTPGPVFTVDDFDDSNVVTSDVAMDDGGNFVVVWEDYYYSRSVLARRFLAGGTPIGDIEFAVPTVQEYLQHAPHVAAQPGGDFVVAWVGYDSYDYDQGYFTGGYGVKARRFRVAPEPPVGCPAAPRDDCRAPTVPLKGQLQLRDNAPDTADNFTWKWVKGEAVTVGDMGDPLATDAFTYCVYDAGGRVMEGVVPPGGTCGGKPCWKDLGGTGFKYVDKGAANAAGVQKIVLKPGVDGAAKAIVKGKGLGVPMPALSLALPVRAQLASAAGTCWEAEFRAEGVLENTAAEFRAKAHAD